MILFLFHVGGFWIFFLAEPVDLFFFSSLGVMELGLWFRHCKKTPKKE